MCELLALSSSQPARLTFSLHKLAARGGLTGRLHDGWGVAFYEGHDVAVFREPRPAADSALVRFLEGQGPATQLAVSHIRHATRGEVSLANTQPYARQLGGRTHVFAHNGDLPGIEGVFQRDDGAYRPVGQSDSERAFCALLARLAPLWHAGDPPPLQSRLSVLNTFAAELRALGPANFLYADGDALFAHGDRRLQYSGRAEPPGLWIRQRRCPPEIASLNAGAGVVVRTASASVVWVASVPLTDDPWSAMGRGELVVIRGGEMLGGNQTGSFATNEADPTPDPTPLSHAGARTICLRP